MANQQTNQTANQQLKDQLDSYKSRISKSRKRKRIAYIAGLCLVAVAIVGLVVPAATLEYGKTYCGQEEHTHTDACVNRTVVCALPDTSNGNGHVHVPSCYDDSSTLAICGKTPVAHMHIPACVNAAGTELICGQEETVHMHTLACIDDATNTYICGAEELPHVHGVTCYSLGADGSYVLVCQELSVGHVHTMLCLDPETGEVVCGQEEAIELEHVHTDACYEEELICGMEEHVHNELCYDEITEAIMKKDEASSAAKEAAEEVEGIEDGMAEGDLTAEEITEAKDQGLLFENEDVVVVFDVPEKYAEDIVLSVTETDEEVVFVEAIEATEEVNAEGEPVDDEAAQDGDNGDPVFFSEEGAEADGTDKADEANKAAAASKPVNAVAAASKTSVADEPAYQINLRIEATLAGEPVDDIEALGITAKLQMKPKVIAPILAEIDYAVVDPEIKDEVGAEITVLQQPDNSQAASISEVRSEQVDEVLATSVQEAATSFAVVASVFTAKATGTTNPSFTVKYMAPVETPVRVENGKGNLDVIDTSAEKNNGKATLPKNMGETGKSGTAISQLQIKDGKVVMENETVDIYREKDFEYFEAPALKYFNTVTDKSYNLSAINVKAPETPKKPLVGDEEPKFTEETYSLSEYDIHFTNRPASAGPLKDDNGNDVLNEAGKKIFYVLINNVSNEEKDEQKKKTWTTTITLIFEPTTATPSFSSQFYDYDISDGLIYRAKPNEPNTYINYYKAGEVYKDETIKPEVLTWAAGLSGWDQHLYTYTKQKGINSSGNYSGSGTKLAFGNVNTGTTLGKLTWKNNGKDNELNKYNNKGYLGCTFGLVTGLNKKGGNIQYASGVNAPKLFNEGTATGKTTYQGTVSEDGDAGQFSLKFDRLGDTYTLSGVNGTKATDLQRFTNPKNSQGNYDGEHDNGVIWTNNFWPMDSATSYGTGTHDVKFGSSTYFKGKAHELRFGPTTEKTNDNTFPESDDGLNHNSYFGMHYAVDFDLDKDYVGPLEYLFFGDDDLWVFLDEKLVIDIGGVHSSVGEYVNLWDYIAKDENGNYVPGSHTLSIYYTERGASGSTCFMNFTLPSVTDVKVPQTTGEVRIEKEVSAPEGSSALTDDEFRFTIQLQDEKGNRLMDDYSYTRYGSDGTKIASDLIVWDGGEFSLKNGEYIIIKHLPAGTQYTVQEVLEDNEPYNVTWNYFVDGQIQAKLPTEDINLRPGEPLLFTGIVKDDKTEYRLKFVNTVPPQLPATGGEGTYWYWIGGGLLVVLALLMLWRRQALASAPASSITPAEASVLAFFGDVNFASLSGKPESVYSKGCSRSSKGDESTRKGGKY